MEKRHEKTEKQKKTLRPVQLFFFNLDLIIAQSSCWVKALKAGASFQPELVGESGPCLVIELNY
jgi:hypothetical protein